MGALIRNLDGYGSLVLRFDRYDSLGMSSDEYGSLRLSFDEGIVFACTEPRSKEVHVMNLVFGMCRCGEIQEGPLAGSAI